MIIHLDAPERSGIAFKRFTFPDGQPHIEFDPHVLKQAAGLGAIDFIGRLKSGNDLLNMALALDAIRSVLEDTTPSLTLNISYLLGARMDRRIAPGQPASLAVVGTLLNSGILGMARVRVLDPHSPVVLTAIPGVETLNPDALVAFALARIQRDTGQAPVVVIPDAGAYDRTHNILSRLNAPHAIARCSKLRDSRTGKLSGFQLEAGTVANRIALIVDDICDGGGTFSGIAQILRANGAEKVYLCVTHGIFSKGIEIDGIDGVFTTDSYAVPDQAGFEIDQDKELESVRLYKRDGKVRLTLMHEFMESILRR